METVLGMTTGQDQECRDKIERSKYSPLYHHISGLDGRVWLTTLERIERILGFDLPQSARRHPAWWSNHVGRHVHARAWRVPGWITTDVDIRNESVKFERDDAR